MFYLFIHLFQYHTYTHTRTHAHKDRRVMGASEREHYLTQLHMHEHTFFYT